MSGVALSLGLLGSMTALTLGAAVVGEVLVEQVRLQSSADQIALLAEDSQRGLVTGFPCELALRTADRFGVQLDTCRILNSEAWIALSTVRMGIVINARAHAGS